MYMNIYQGRQAVLATKHKKEEIMAPLFAESLGIEVVVPKEFDTDRFGAFTGEKKRRGDQLETARAKAMAAIRQTGISLGIASEGSFGAHPTIPFAPCDQELVVFLDTERGIEIAGMHSTCQVHMDCGIATSVHEAVELAKKWDFPANGIILKKRKHSRWLIEKDIDSLEEFEVVVANYLTKPFSRSVYLETDLRAHRNALRREAIRQATGDLINRIQSLCPRCQSPGFVSHRPVHFVLCRVCLSPSQIPDDYLFTCSVCSESEVRKNPNAPSHGNPEYCLHCNP